MQGEADARDLAMLTRETQELWEGKADFWDAQMGEGNTFSSVRRSSGCSRHCVAKRSLTLRAAMGSSRDDWRC